MEIHKDVKGQQYTLEEFNDGSYEGFVIDANDTQIVRVERDAMTGERHVYVWDGIQEDYAVKVKFNPFHKEI